MIPANTFLGGQAAAASPDYTPDAVDWTDITAGGFSFALGYGNSQTITGINQPITLAITYAGSGVVNLNAFLNSASPVSITSGSTLIVHNGDTLYFTASATVTATGTVTIKNNSDTGTPTLDTFSYTLTIS